MPTYEATVLSRNPVFYARLDESLGPQITDISVNAHHGVYDSAAVFGIASPIETDPGSTAIGSVVGQVTAAVASPRDLTANFTWEAWVYYNPPQMLSNTAHVINRRGQWGQTHTCQIGINGGAITFSVTLVGAGSGEHHQLTAPVMLQDATWYHIVGTRNGTVARLYVNGVLEVADTGLSAAAVDYNVAGSDWYFGRSINTTAFASAGTDEIALYDFALTAAEVLENYEAAVNRLLSSATIQVRVQVMLDTDAPEPIDFPFAHNWTEPISGSERVITEHLSYRTHSNRSEPDYEQRVNARPYGPRRALEYAITPTSPLARAVFQRTLFQPAQVFKLPILTDWTPLTATANPSDAMLSCDTTLRDFEVGSSCVAFTDPYNPATFQFFRITSRTDSQLGVSPVVGAAIVNGLVAPARLAYLPAEESQLESYVIDRETGVLSFEILDTELSTRRVTTYTPMTTYQPNLAKPAVEVFSLDSARFDILEQTPYSIRQRQSGTGNLTGNDYFRGVNTATSSTIPVRVLLGTRESLSEFYGWLEARQGRQNPVWVPSKENDLTFISQISGTVLRIEPGYLFYNLHYGRRDVQITFTDGSVANRRITAVVDNGNGTESITLNASVGANVAKISWLRFCVAPDSFELRFHRDIATPGNMVVECAWEFSELLTTP